MNHPRSEWSEPSYFAGRGAHLQPRTFTEADPISAMMPFDWFDDDPAEEPAAQTQASWGPATYVGHPRDKPRQRKHAGPRRKSDQKAEPGPAEPAVVEETVVEGEDRPESIEHTDAHTNAHTGAEPTRAHTGVHIEAEQDRDGTNRGLMANSRTMAVASLASRVTGFLRSSMLVAALGIHGVGDAYNVANNFPNMVYELLLGGVLSSVLIPLLVHAQQEDSDGGVAYTQRLLSIATAALGAMTLVAVACAPWIASAFVPDPSQRSLTSIFATLLLPEIFFYGLGAMFMAVLNVRHSYGPGAWAPVLNNIVMIVTIALFWLMPGPTSLNPATMTNAQILVLGFGTTAGIAVQALVLIPTLRQTGFQWRWRFRAYANETGRMKEVGSLAGWVLGYVVASQIGVTVIAKVGVSNHAFTVFTNADLLLQMPYGILVVSLLTALMPRLSRAAARGDEAAVIADLGLGARLSAVALIPITAGLIVLGPAMNVVLFAYGQTSIDGARLIGTALAASAFGLFPFALVMLQLRVFYAMRDGKTPTLINVGMVGTKVLLVLIAEQVFSSPAHIAEALTVATSASYVVGAVIGHLALTRRLGSLKFGAVLTVATKLSIASAVGALAAFAIVKGCSDLLGTGHGGSLAALVLGGAGGLIVLGALMWRLRVAEVEQVRALLRRR